MTAFAPLREQLRSAATAFADEADAVAEILTGMVDDVDRALAEELEIVPVCHHSPASALAMVRRLHEKRPSVIYLELCEDLRPLLDELPHCTLPVALQAFANEPEGLPTGWSPLSVVAPLTEASAEYQAIAYALRTPEAQIVLVDRSTDHIFTWAAADSAEPPGDNGLTPATDADSENTALHGDAVGISIDDLRPRFAELESYLLHHGRVRHWSEWWDQYVELPLSTADYDTYRQVMVMIGSLFRRLRREPDTENDHDEDRERYMWTRIRQHLAATGTDPAGCLYVCGAFHAASRVEQFGLRSQADFPISPPSATRWCYGLIPSSHSAIEAQFGHAAGSVSIAAATWARELKHSGLTAFKLDGRAAKGGNKRRKVATEPPQSGSADRLANFLTTAPSVEQPDEAELRSWCVDIVHLGRRNGYLASTADAIAIFENAILLAAMRNRARPTPYDFQDAAITCLEKDHVPGRRDVARLCEILLGGDRIGRVGYDALPPLARDVLDRLAPLELNLQARTIQRALLDLRTTPQLQRCSDLLWMLRRLLPADAVRPIMGERRLGERSIQESWDIALGRNQRALIELGYEGVTLEQVLEQRLRQAASGTAATAADALAAVEDALRYLGSVRLAQELGVRAIALLAAEQSVANAPAVLSRFRVLLAYFRSVDPQLPRWCEDFATTGFAHYCTLLPTAVADDEVGVRQVAAMLGFLFGMESMALSLGCDRSQLEIAVRQTHPQSPDKVALLWAAQLQLGLLTADQLRARCLELLRNPLVVPSFPDYLSGFVQALDPVPAVKPVVVELLSRSFGELPDAVLLPWLPTLVTTLGKQAGEHMATLVGEAARTFPASFAEVDSWTPPWEEKPPASTIPATAALPAAPSALLARYPEAAAALAELLVPLTLTASPRDR